MGPTKPSIVALTFYLFPFRGFCGGAPELQTCSDSPGECRQEADTISNLQTDASLINKVDGDVEDAFHTYIREFGRTYLPGSPEYIERLGLFTQRKLAVDAQNGMADRLWTAGINAHSDRHGTELKRLLGDDGPRKNYGVSGSGSISLRQEGNGSQVLARECTKWLDLDAVKDIQNQESCGSCWALSAITVLRSHSEIAKKPRSFSAQELVDCVVNKHHCGGSGGCRGATVEHALDYVMRNGLATKEESPYYAVRSVCEKPSRKQEQDMDELFRPKLHKASVSDASRSFGMVGWERLPENKYEPILHAVSEKGPVAVSVAATGWFSYSQGIFDGCSLNAVINHAVNLIGYGEEDGTKYWLIQNAWGTGWGENGKMRLLRTDDEGQKCGTDYRPEVGSGCDNGPHSVRVCGTCGILYNAMIPHFKP